MSVSIGIRLSACLSIQLKDSSQECHTHRKHTVLECSSMFLGYLYSHVIEY